MPIDACGKATFGLGVLVLIAAALSGIWELLALQSPGTSFYIGMLPGPIGALRELATAIGVLLLIAALWMPSAAPARVSLRVVVALLYAGSALSLSAQLYAALHGMAGAQIVDMRPDALPLFVARQGGLVILIAGLLELARRVLRRQPRAQPEPQPGPHPEPQPQPHPGSVLDHERHKPPS